MITTKIALVIGIALATASAANAQNRTFYDAAGRVTGKARTDSGGATTFYVPSGFVTGRARTDNNGVTTFYDASGRVTGSARAREPR